MRPILFLVSIAFLLACSQQPEPTAIRFATFNVAMGLNEEGALASNLQSTDHPQLERMAEIIQRIRPDVLLLNEFDHQEGFDAYQWLTKNYLQKSWNGQTPIDYPYHFVTDVNTGLDSGLDLNSDGQLHQAEDAWGYGQYTGQYGMLVLSRFPIDNKSIRTFQKLTWASMPDAQRPYHADGKPYHPDDIWQALRLSSKSHWDIPIQIDQETAIHFLVTHPTPPVFDGPEDRNGKRNYDEIRLWADYVNPLADPSYLIDDRGQTGGLNEPYFVIAGDMNADLHDGDSSGNSILQLLDNPAVNSLCIPKSRGGVEAASEGINPIHQTDPATDTSDFNDERVGNLRLDYVLPSSRLYPVDCGVFWPASDEEGSELLEGFDHRMVWVDVAVPEENP